MNQLHKKLFYRFVAVVSIIFFFFVIILSRVVDYTAINYIKEKLEVAANQIDVENPTYQEIFKIQREVQIYPFYVSIWTKGEGFILFNNEIYPLQESAPGFHIEKYFGNPILVYVTQKGDKVLRISTLIQPQLEKVQLAKTFSTIFGIVIYFVVIISGYMFIRSMSNRIEEHIKRLRMFNSNISHELRTPLTVIKGEIELGRQGVTQEECQEILKEIEGEIDHISEITEKLLFITKQENIDPKSFHPIDLEEVLLELFEKYSPKIPIDLDIPEEEEQYLIIGDKALIKIALSNLIENSIKYGASRVRLGLERGEDGIVVELEDNGQGIPPEKLPYIFDAFYRVDDSRTRKVKGFGLGLSIVKTIIHLHQAQVSIESEGVGKGVKFRLKFPLPEELERRGLLSRLKRIIYG
jgi:signal transduction histidine kinase